MQRALELETELREAKQRIADLEAEKAAWLKERAALLARIAELEQLLAEALKKNKGTFRSDQIGNLEDEIAYLKALLAKEKAGRNKCFRGAGNRMMNYQLSKAWEKWQYEYEREKRDRAMVTKGMGHWHNFNIGKAWNKWRAVFEVSDYLAGTVI